MSDKLNFGIVGTNFISDAFVKAAKLSEKCKTVAVYSRTKEKGEAFAKKHGIPLVYTSFDEMLDSEELDAVYIASPTFLHKEMAVKALQKGKHALIEKMISINFSEFLEIKKAMENSSAIFLEAMRPDFDRTFEIIEENLSKIGKIKEVSLEFRQYSSRYDNFKRGIVENAFNPSIKNSALSDIGIYPLHLAVRLFGEPIDTSAKSHFLENGFEAEGELSLLYPDFSVNISYSKIFEGKNISFIKGERGTISFGKINAPNSFSVVIDGKETVLDFTAEENNMLSEINAFCDTVRGEKKYLRFIDVSKKTLLLVDKIYEKAGIRFPLRV